VTSSPPGRRHRLTPHELWARAAAAAKRRQWEERLALQIKAWGLPEAEREHRFHPTRLWRFDFAFVAFHVAAEIEGGIWIGGRHVQAAGYEADSEKYAEAARLGWVVLRFTPGQVKSGYAVRVIEDVLARRKPETPRAGP
jgi:very-short-patch-repair endonuclease